MSLKYDIYLDTSVINFLLADDAPEKKAITIDFFDNFIKTEKYNTYISNFVIEEINNTSDEKKRNDLLQVLQSCPMQLLEIENSEIEKLSSKYLEAGVIP